MDLVIITGTPGTGKTVVSQKICEVSNSRYVSLNDLAIKEDLILKFDEKRDTKVVNNNKIIERVETLIKEQINTEYDYFIIESHFSDLVPSKYIDYAVVLRCHPDNLVIRLKSKGYKKAKVMENVQSEILGNCINFLTQKKLKYPPIEIDTTNLTVGQVAEKIINAIQTKNYEKIIQVDWLEVLFRENRLNEFFE